jgi:transcription elongation factor Elf1
MESIPGYDGWKLATPWDDEISTTVSFECWNCQAYNDSVEAITGKNDSEAYVHCEECDAENSVDVGGDW